MVGAYLSKEPDIIVSLLKIGSSWMFYWSASHWCWHIARDGFKVDVSLTSSKITFYPEKQVFRHSSVPHDPRHSSSKTGLW